MVRDRSKIAHIFVLETIEEAFSAERLEVKSMFGAHSVYIDGKIVCTLRDRPRSPQDNGVWIVMSENYFDELKAEFPSLRHIEMFSHLGAKGFKSWVNLPQDGPHFEEEALHFCELVIGNDPRIGKLPKSKTSVIKAKTQKPKAPKKKATARKATSPKTPKRR